MDVVQNLDDMYVMNMMIHIAINMNIAYCQLLIPGQKEDFCLSRVAVGAPAKQHMEGLRIALRIQHNHSGCLVVLIC